ncbi:MAG: LysE family translocator [Bacteroidales bacterium]|nr:LysE family translocator [Bacteroidales bacterium]
MFTDILKAMLVGVCAAVPVGPVLIMVLQRTLRYGRKAGIACGTGSACADTLWATLGVFALTLVQNFVDKHEGLIMAVGGGLITIIGCLMFFKDSSKGLDSDVSAPKAGFALQTFGSAMSNPAALAVMLALLASFQLDKAHAEIPVWLVLLCVFVGEFCYWQLVTFIVSRFLKVNARMLNLLSKIAGAAVFVIGIFLIIKGIISLV